MENLTRASKELFRRGPDECFATFSELSRQCSEAKVKSSELWYGSDEMRLDVCDGQLMLELAGTGKFELNDWSFSQLCSLARVSKDTVNKLSPATICRVFDETLPRDSKPLQYFVTTNGDNRVIRSIHGASYTRLYDVDVLSMVREFAVDFCPPQEAGVAPNSGGVSLNSSDADQEQKSKTTGGTGLYRGEQDMFVFMIDPMGWAEINGEPFAPGFFLWNSEVGKRTLGIQTFWFQAICRNHIVWDAVEVVEYSRKHTANVHEAFNQIRRIIERLVNKRDERRDGFVHVIRKAMETKLGETPDDVLKALRDRGFTRALAKEALGIAEKTGRFTVFSLVNALTRMSRETQYIGERTEMDAKTASLLTLAT